MKYHRNSPLKTKQKNPNENSRFVEQCFIFKNELVLFLFFKKTSVMTTKLRNLFDEMDHSSNKYLL